jgi:kinetochore protein Spc7/SPC105
MDEITAPQHSTNPLQMRLAPHNQQASASEILLAKYMIAIAVNIPQLKLYTCVYQDLQAWVKQSKYLIFLISYCLGL